jgi:DNA-binding transcriptional LysR family regulator
VVSSRPELVALRSFLSVYRTGGVARAAEALHLSQPAVSHHLKTIEEAVGRPLFTRSGRGIAPTEAGHTLAAEIADHVDALEGALDTMRSVTLDSAGPVFVGAPVDLLERFVTPRVTPLLANGLTMRCRIGLSPDLVPAALRDELDVVLLTKIEGVPGKRMYLVHLHDEEFVLIGQSGEREYRPGERPARRFVGYSEDMPMARRYFRECWGIKPPAPALTVADFRTVIAAVRAGAGLTVAPSYLVRDELAAGTLAVVHTPERPVLNPIHVGTRRGREHLPRIRAMFNCLAPE